MNKVENEKPDPLIERTAGILDAFFPPPRRFTIRLWNGIELPSGSPPAFTLVLNHPGALRQLFQQPLELSAGEAYIHGDYDVEGDLDAAIGLFAAITGLEATPQELSSMLREVRRLPETEPKREILRKPAELQGVLHSRERDREAIRYHYDVGNDFYALWLGRTMQYSCAYFPSGNEDLDTAQDLKIRRICDRLQLKPGERLLDIGCGWGGLAIAAARWYGADVTGVTLSESQAEYGAAWAAREGTGGRLKIRLCDYRDLKGETFDKVVSVRMYEHVGRSHLPEYYSQVCRLLEPGGLFLNHGISRSSRPSDRNLLKGLDLPAAPQAAQGYFDTPPGFGKSQYVERVIGEGTFSQRYIFPDRELVLLSEANLIAESTGFEVVGVEDLRGHYLSTLRHWIRRLEEHRDEAVRLAGEEVFRTWRLYLYYSANHFENRHNNIHHTLLQKPPSAKSAPPLFHTGFRAEP